MNLKDYLSKTFLFRDVEGEKNSDIFSNISPYTKTYEKGEAVFSPDTKVKRLGFVISGECEVRRLRSDNTYVPLNKLKRYDSFGIISLFSENREFPTYVFSTQKCSVLFIDAKDVEYLIANDHRISVSIIKFLTNRIEFLNQKIATFSSAKVDEKLAHFILLEAKRLGCLEFEFNKKRSAEAISSGRASLYRAMDALTEKELITYDSKKIYIKDLDGLERMSK